MNLYIPISVALVGLFAVLSASANVSLDEAKFGESLGGWKAKKGKAVEYLMADNEYRTYRPTVSPTPEGGIFISVRIDHIRGFFSSDDHASLELTVDPKGNISSARSSISFQGKRVTSDLIVSGANLGKTATKQTPVEGVMSLSTDLVANLTEKLSRETKTEPGRVTFPSVVQHNFNLLYQALATAAPSEEPVAAEVNADGAVQPVAEVEEAKTDEKAKETPPAARLDINIQDPNTPATAG